MGGYGGSSMGMTMTTPPTSANYSRTELVANVAGGTATTVDPQLENPWGLVIAPGAPAWLANNGTQTSTLYDGLGHPQPQAGAGELVVTLPPGTGGVAFDPTGMVFNAGASDFVISAAGKSGPASFIYAGESGAIAGWSSSVSPTAAVTAYADTQGAVYKGLALATYQGKAYLYATDFHNAKVDVFDSTFTKQPVSSSSFTFQDPGIPAGYAPFGIQALPTGSAGAVQIYVTYAQQAAPQNHDQVSGAGLGFVDVYDTNGQLIKQLVANGVLNAPWGLALAPADFGALSGALLVGNFGDGTINAFDAASGAMIGTVRDASGNAFQISGLWGLAFGNDALSQPHNTLFYTAGPNQEMGGLYGRIDVGTTPSGY